MQILEVTEFLYRWHAEAMEGSDLKFFMFRIGGCIYPATLNAFRKSVWEVKGCRFAHPKTM